MGRKKKKEAKPYCWYCGPERSFDDENVLIQHQRSKHFKCHVCHKKLTTATALKTHVLFVHKEEVTKVPNAKDGRDEFEFDIIGMQGVPEGEEWLEQSNKRPKTAAAQPAPAPTPTVVTYPGQPGYGYPQQGGFPRPGMPGMPMNPYGAPPGYFPGQNPYGAPPPMGAPLFPVQGGPPRPGFPPGGAPPAGSPGAYPPQQTPVAPPGAPVPPAGQPAPGPAQGQKVYLVYDDEQVSMEERRAELPQYRFDDTARIKSQLLAVESRLGNVLGRVPT